MPLIVRNPPVDDALAKAVVELWIQVTDAGGAVGFLPGATPQQVRPVAQAALERVRQGSADLALALQAGRPVALGFLERSATPVNAHRGMVARLQRHPSLRGGGIGAAVLAELEAAAAERHLDLVTLIVRGGTGREGYYAALGYRIDGRLPARIRLADGSLIEEIHMSKPLTPLAAAGTGPTLLVQRLDAQLPLPAYAHPGDAGLDLFAADGVELAPGARALVPTGVAVAVPEGCVGLVHPRSGLAVRHGIGIVNAPGTVDAGYRGEIKVLLVNLDPAESVRLERGDRIAQLVVQQVEQVHVIEAAELPLSTRGAGGFGSTGR